MTTGLSLILPIAKFLLLELISFIFWTITFFPLLLKRAKNDSFLGLILSALIQRLLLRAIAALSFYCCESCRCWHRGSYCDRRSSY